jgi:hypothetical protein
MSEFIGYRPNDKGETERRINALIAASRNRITKSDILRNAMDKYLTLLESGREYSLKLEQLPTPSQNALMDEAILLSRANKSNVKLSENVA